MMKIPIIELEYDSQTKFYDKGYRIVYYYRDHHEIIKDLCVDKLSDLLDEKINDEKKLVEKILEKYLNLNEKALGVSIYSIPGTEIARRIKENEVVDDYVKFKEELMYDYGVKNIVEGYRIVYFYNDDNYTVGTFSKTIEGFMMDFIEVNPIEDEGEIPSYTSIDDILNRYLNDLSGIIKVAIYKTDGTCIAFKNRQK